jgi:hypothetical protein
MKRLNNPPRIQFTSTDRRMASNILAMASGRFMKLSAMDREIWLELGNKEDAPGITIAVWQARIVWDYAAALNRHRLGLQEQYVEWAAILGSRIGVATDEETALKEGRPSERYRKRGGKVKYLKWAPPTENPVPTPVE